MKLYNSYSQTIEELKPIEPGKISMYVCGPTVYNYPHIGNARPIVVFDTLKKALSAQGYEVTFASNYTDVDDKIIKTAIEQNVTEKEITDKFIVARLFSACCPLVVRLLFACCRHWQNTDNHRIL